MSDTYSQGCPIAVALDTIGDRWMLLLLRDLAHAPMRYSDLQAINPKMSPNLLSKRLRQLQDAGLVSKRDSRRRERRRSTNSHRKPGLRSCRC